MKLTHLGHSTLLVESADARLLIDPGGFSDGWTGLTELDAVLVTHRHPDHLDAERLPDLLRANPQAQVLVEPETVGEAALGDRGRAFAPDTETVIGGIGIRAVGGTHAVIHRDLPMIGNIGLMFAGDGPTLFHPGDSLATVPPGVDLLALPVMGPWAAMKEHIDFVRAVGAAKAFGIHDGLINDRYRQLIGARLAELTETTLLSTDAEGRIEAS